MKNGRDAGHPKFLVIYEKKSGLPKFTVPVQGSQEAAVERAASLLALGCSMRGDAPNDYSIWIPAANTLMNRVASRARELLCLGQRFSSDIVLSPREEEVLKEVMRNHANKEIAARLNISVRTVKFHVSSLLSKFEVQSRWDMIRKAARMFGEERLMDVCGDVSFPGPRSSAPARGGALPVRKVWGRGEEAPILPFPARLRSS